MPLTAALHETLTMVLAGGKGDRLQPLTRDRAKPAVPFGGLYRIIDFTLSNCIHSGLRRIYVLTQYQARSLEEHMRFGWSFLPRRLGQFISLRPPHLRTAAKWYQGTADAIYQNLDAFEDDQPKRVLILSGDHIYKMDYGKMLLEHMDNGASLTIAAVPVPVDEASRYGVFECEPGGRVIGFEEKPEHPKEIPGRPGWSLASMGVYLFETEELARRVREDAENPTSTRDFGKDVIPAMIGESRVFAHHFTEPTPNATPYWRDIGTLDSYYEANLDLCRPQPSFNLYDKSWPTYTFQHAEPPAKTVTVHSVDGESYEAHVSDSIMCPGVVVSGGTVAKSILSYQVRVDEGAEVDASILLAGVSIGAGAKVRRAIVDKWTRIPAGAKIGFDEEEDRRRYRVTESGIVVISRCFEFDQAQVSGSV